MATSLNQICELDCTLTKKSFLKKENWRNITAERIKEIDWDYVRSDVEPFLENQDDLKILTKQTLLKLLS